MHQFRLKLLYVETALPKYEYKRVPLVILNYNSKTYKIEDHGIWLPTLHCPHYERSEQFDLFKNNNYHLSAMLSIISFNKVVYVCVFGEGGFVELKVGREDGKVIKARYPGACC